MHAEVLGHCNRTGRVTGVKAVDTMGTHTELKNSISRVAGGDRGLDPGRQGEQRSGHERGTRGALHTPGRREGTKEGGLRAAAWWGGAPGHIP